jgi:DNA-binding PucR family transcriptional regulator
VHVLGDLVMEVQVTRPGPARDALERLLEPVSDHPDLGETLVAYVDAGGRRAEAARALHVHPNTLDYRLNRIADLTGIDPADRVGGEQLRWALVVHRYLGR